MDRAAITRADSLTIDLGSGGDFVDGVFRETRRSAKREGGRVLRGNQ